jgi:hypothetical protein
MTPKTHLALCWSKLLIVASLCLWFGTYGAAQASQPSPPLPGATPQPSPTEDPWEIQQRKEMIKKVNLQRQQEIKKDTEKLLQLATELKQSVDKSNENTLSLDVIKKAEQIEKLAKVVKDKMKGS